MEYGSSALTEDARSKPSENIKGFSGIFFNNKISTTHHNALKAVINYNLKKSNLGLSYEMIDPGYKTLGSYYFNNDFENITLNFSTQLFNKINLSFNTGYQHDDLNRQKQNKMDRTLVALNTSINLSKKINLSASYSNFNAVTNTKLNQFENINDENLLDNEMELLNYKQLSQNANFVFNYVLSNEEKKANQNINFNYALASVVNFENDLVRKGGVSSFHNFNLTHNLLFTNKKQNITSSLNATVNKFDDKESVIWGPNVNFNTKFFNEKVDTNFSTSYNQGGSGDLKTQTTVFRLNSSVILAEKHQFNLNLITLFKSQKESQNYNMTFTLGYNYILSDLLSRQ